MALRKLKTLVGREFLVIGRSALMLLLIVILPVTFSMIFASFKQVIPNSTPASLIAASPEVTESEMNSTFKLLSRFCSPSIDSREDAFRKLSREEVYFIVSVPSGVWSGEGNVRVFVDNSLSPVAEMSDYVAEILKYELGEAYRRDYLSFPPPNILVEKIGKPISPIEYFAPGVVMVLLAIAGILVIPFNTVKDHNLMTRLLSSASPWEFIGSKLLFSLLLASLQIAIFFIAQSILRLPVMSVNLLSAITLILASFALTSTGLLIAFAFKLSNLSRYVCSLLFGAVATFSGIFYPPGFLPSYLQPIPKILPTYYAMVLVRGFGMKGLEAGIFVDYFAIMVVWLVISLALLYYFIRRFRDG
ncbi:MAG: hypothetical protein Sv326_0561 [Candidatus Fermentimicrarchaeum limneticum]|uniref:ABC-2 type transporter transmembrane domain-containing protein n=1 Tax=Fermentimicrarchaeum limneticum TaxID=2795018 RepID=A0A7D6BLF2_FERL1|nr:MAG: hypothetical protein Sv326_0561 [Candidatus Fermentimicrarchaeum limneticum]